MPEATPDWLRRSVSRETLNDLNAFADLIRKWNRTINLVSPHDMAVLYQRHIWDSANLLHHITAPKLWLDVGSGGGFPGIVVAIFYKADHSVTRVVLVESDKRKAAFLRVVATELVLNIEIVNERVENAANISPDVISARAFRPLAAILHSCHHLSVDKTTWLLPKGTQWRQEVRTASADWAFDLTAHESPTNISAAVLELHNVRRITEDTTCAT